MITTITSWSLLPLAGGKEPTKGERGGKDDGDDDDGDDKTMTTVRKTTTMNDDDDDGNKALSNMVPFGPLVPPMSP